MPSSQSYSSLYARLKNAGLLKFEKEKNTRFTPAQKTAITRANCRIQGKVVRNYNPKKAKKLIENGLAKKTSKGKLLVEKNVTYPGNDIKISGKKLSIIGKLKLVADSLVYDKNYLEEENRKEIHSVTIDLPKNVKNVSFVLKNSKDETYASNKVYSRNKVLDILNKFYSLQLIHDGVIVGFIINPEFETIRVK